MACKQAFDAAQSYDVVTRAKKGDMSSQRTAFRHFNNFIKKLLIQFALDTIHEKNGPTRVKVLDLACGRGGDLGKWMFSESPAINVPCRKSGQVDPTYVGYYSGFDVSPECVAESQRRYAQLEKKGDADFAVADCFGETFVLSDVRQVKHYGCFDVVSIQFAFHYACYNEDIIDRLLRAVSDALKEGGVFIVTTVDLDELARRLGDATTYHGALFQIDLESPAPVQACSKYIFKLEGFVDCPEYAVPAEHVVQRCAEHGLREIPAYSKKFSAFLPEYTKNSRINKGNVLSADEIDLVTLYRTFCFVKL